MSDLTIRQRPILGSILLHGILLIALLWIGKHPEIFQSSDEQSKPTWIEVQLPDNLHKQIVQSKRGDETDTAKPEAFLSDKNRVVKEQTVTKSGPSVFDSPQKAKAREKQEDQAQAREKDKPTVALRDLGVPLFRDAAEKPRDRPDFAPLDQPGQKPGEDYVKGINEANETALNTREYIFFSYFKRIREQLDLAWRPILRTQLEKVYRQGRYIASDREHKTRTLVTLNDRGEIVRVQVLEESGTRDLDSAAVQAFNRAGPFPNPPRGLINGKREIEIQWDFILRT